MQQNAKNRISKNVYFLFDKKDLILFISIPFILFHIYSARFGVITPQLNRGIYIGGTFLLTFLIYYHNGKLKYIDIFLMILTCISVIYFIYQFPSMAYRAGSTTLLDLFFGGIMIFLCIETTRRVIGNSLTIIATFFIIYVLFGHCIPGMLGHSQISFSRLISFMYNSLFGIFGNISNIFANYVLPFIIFGTFLENSGASSFFIDISYSLTGTTKGGPAKTAVLASALMGSISGSTAANVVTTGTFTIPLMKKIGYKPHTAAAIEAAASTGGQLMPPIMGAAAFVMSEFTGIPYWKIVTVSIFPAFLYFFTVFFLVDVSARKLGLKAMKRAELPSIKKTLRSGWYFLTPLIIIFFLLARGNSPSYAAFWAIISTIIVSYFNKKKAMTISKVIYTLRDSAVRSLIVGSTVGSIGIIIGTIYLTGIGEKFSDILLSLSTGSLPMTIVLIAIASYLLGMGMTTVSTYIILSVLAAPALVNLGVSLLPAHLIIFWLSQSANLTPPVCVASYAAAGIAGANPARTGLEALKFAKNLYAIPFLMAYTSILLNGDILQIFLSFVGSFVFLLILNIIFEKEILINILMHFKNNLSCLNKFVRNKF